MEVYERAIPAVPKDQRLAVVELYISRATDFFGIAKVQLLRNVCCCVGGTACGLHLKGWQVPCQPRRHDTPFMTNSSRPAGVPRGDVLVPSLTHPGQ